MSSGHRFKIDGRCKLLTLILPIIPPLLQEIRPGATFMTIPTHQMDFAKYSRCFLKFLRVRHRASLQVDHVGMSPVLLIFVAQSGRKAALIIPPEQEMTTETGGTSVPVS